MDSIQSEKRRTMARAWFEALRDEITAAFEALEDALPAAAPLADRAPGQFKRTPGIAPTMRAGRAAAASWR